MQGCGVESMENEELACQNVITSYSADTQRTVRPASNE